MTSSDMNPEERAVLEIIKAHGPIHQREIARHERWLGLHEKHETGIGIPNPDETTLRKVRQLIRNLRLTYNIPVLSDRDGYWVTYDKAEIAANLDRLERTARSQAKAWMVTYNVLKRHCDARSAFFESLDSPNPGGKPIQQSLFGDE